MKNLVLLISTFFLFSNAFAQIINIPDANFKAKLLEGEVEMDANYALEKDQLDDGFILSCQSHPKTNKIILDFDA